MSRPFRLTLVYPSVGRKPGRPYVRAWQMQPLSMAVLAGLTPSDVDIRFYDDRMESIPFDEPTDLVALSVETYTALRAYRIARAFRQRGVPVVLGGYHVTLCPEEAGAEADAIVVGDAEPVWRELLSDARRRELKPLYNGRVTSPLAGIVPRREIFGTRSYQKITLVESARGCNFRCDFCAITAFHQMAQRHRPAHEVAAEMASTEQKRFFIVDDNFVSQPAKARELCRALKPLGIRWVGQASVHIAHDDELLQLMAESGCMGVLIGIESLDPHNLHDMDKQWNVAGSSYVESLRQFRKHGLAIYATFVFGYDHDTPETIQRSVDFAREQKLFLAAFNHLTPFPGTPLYERLRQQGRLLSDRWWLDPQGHVGDVTFRPRHMSPEDLKTRCLAARREFYSWHSLWQRGWDFQVNASSPLLLAVFLGLNIGHHFDIDLRQDMQLGVGSDGGGGTADSLQWPGRNACSKGTHASGVTQHLSSNLPPSSIEIVP